MGRPIQGGGTRAGLARAEATVQSLATPTPKPAPTVQAPTSSFIVRADGATVLPNARVGWRKP